ncbi:group II intron reverse transcriptase/maturase [Cytophagaceae bacterium ABcell3]|nr:group II intron reverse transcriptase/maturase [Cytophagaceae bacterium ABcell3]WMJ75381.1 group II intron reverse transcriptase/maturase [Cytophagaceae bacterium ABcell3]WMJ75384.1 group II intron reverse transcriptase/maturase [Cytophagaceae bacterium ABcell3]
MIDYYETKSQPITRIMVWRAYKKVRANKGSHGIDKMDWDMLDKDLQPQIYKLWNRLSSGSYFPMPVRESAIKKKSGGVRKLGIPTILDRIAQEVVKTHLERIMEPQFHNSSFGYRPGRNCHQAVNQAWANVFNHEWAIDLDIKSFFDTIDHDMLLKAVEHYCQDKWVLLYVKRWLEAGIIQGDGCYIDRTSGTPQGGVISPLLANIFLHVCFDKWMEKYHPRKPFERYADDIVVHCKSESQALYMRDKIQRRMSACKLELNKEKSKIINLRGESENKYCRSFDFLGFTFRPEWTRLKSGLRLMPRFHISHKSVISVLEKFRRKKIHKWRKSLEELARELNPVIRGVINYYCYKWSNHTRRIWYELNNRLLKWVKWEKGLYKRSANRWLREKYKAKPDLFAHWKLVYPKVAIHL